jgi:hypothetical protein
MSRHLPVTVELDGRQSRMTQVSPTDFLLASIGTSQLAIARIPGVIVATPGNRSASADQASPLKHMPNRPGLRPICCAIPAWRSPCWYTACTQKMLSLSAIRRRASARVRGSSRQDFLSIGGGDPSVLELSCRGAGEQAFGARCQRVCPVIYPGGPVNRFFS